MQSEMKSRAKESNKNFGTLKKDLEQDLKFIMMQIRQFRLKMKKNIKN